MKPEKAWKAIGQVYLAMDGAGLAKIGFSRKPAQRVRDLRNGLVLVATAPGTLLHEWAIHSILAKYQVRPEWYRIDDIPAWLFGELHDRLGEEPSSATGPDTVSDHAASGPVSELPKTATGYCHGAIDGRPTKAETDDAVQVVAAKAGVFTPSNRPIPSTHSNPAATLLAGASVDPAIALATGGGVPSLPPDPDLTLPKGLDRRAA